MKKTILGGPALLLAVCMISACGGEEPSRETEATRGSAVSPAGSCVDACGGQSDDGCWCDDQCELFGDCCFDKEAACNDPCEDVSCGPGEHCELEQVYCVTAPCPPIPMCVPNDCPDPNDPSVHYVADSDQDPSVCLAILFQCDEGQTLFSNECGCGCIDDEPEPYEPCAGKACGDACSWCAPDDPDCVEPAVVKACDADGACVVEPVSCEPEEPNCNETGCGEGEWCSWCWGSFVCIPDGAQC